MFAWKFNRGVWTSLEKDPLWEDGKDTYSDMESGQRWREMGYGGCPDFNLGPESPIVIRSSERGGHFVVEIVSPFSKDLGNIYVEDLPSLLQLLPQIVGWDILHLHAEIQEIKDIAEKAFRAWHGHDMSSVCRECDPEEYERRQKWALEYRKSKKGN